MIKFWKTQEKWGEFSNFYRREVQIDGHVWKTTEHYFQAMKFFPDAVMKVEVNSITHEVNIQSHIAGQEKPKLAALEGRRKDLPLRPDWEQIKDAVMRRAVYAKFTQHPDLRRLLLSTGDEKIIEDSPTDAYWGCGADGTGKNMLGVILMEIREELRAEMLIEPDRLRQIEKFLIEHAATEPKMVGVLGLMAHIEVLQTEVDYWRSKYA